MDNSKSQSFASGYFSYLQIIKITRMSPEIYLFVPSCIMGVLGSLSFFSGRHKFARETVSEVTWPPYNSEGCEGSTLKLASSRKRDLCVARKLVNLSCSFRYSDLEGMLTSLSVSQPLFLLFRLKDFFDTRL